MVAMKINLHNVAYVLTLFFLTTVVVTNGLDLKTKYVKYNEDGEPEHFHIDLSKRCPKIGCLNKGRLTADCSCKCRGFWLGASCEKCGLMQSDCRHGSILDQDTCRCVSCPAPWGGHLCDTCSIKTTKHGEVDPETCRIKECPLPWTGSDCKTCLRDESFCGQGSILNKATCLCDNCPAQFNANTIVNKKKAVIKAKVEEKIAELKREKAEENKANQPIKKAEGGTDWLSWADAFGFLEVSTGKSSSSSRRNSVSVTNIPNSFCGKCPVKKCSNDGTVDMEKCACVDCAENWGGLRCDKCLLEDGDCQNGAILDKASCSCSVACTFPWGGPLCTDCKRSEDSCFHSGKFDEDTCRCKECDAPWKGAICGECGITTEHCKNGGTPCTKSCRCVNCNRPWRGQFCKQCGLSNDDCENGGTVDTNTCTCTCKMPWGGKACATCKLPKETCTEGTVLSQNMCACVPNPKGTAQLAMEKAEKAKKELSVAMKDPRGNLKDVKKFLATPRAENEETSFLEFVETEKKLPRRPKVGKIVTCKFTGVPDLMTNFVGPNQYYGRTRGGYFQHLFVDQECTNGKLPDPREGEWISSLAISHACGEPDQWSIISPNEQDGPGIMFDNKKPCVKNGAMSVQVDFFLPDQKKYKKDYHRCVWQGTPERFIQPNPAKGGSNAGYSKLMSLPSWWTATPEDHIAAREDPGKVDADSGTILKKFKLSSDPRAWSEHSNADFPGSITATSPGYHRHVFSAEDCTNGHPPTDRKCFVSMRWGESCGGDRDWRALHNFKGKESDIAAGVEWYTGCECDSARVGVDYFCPKQDKDFNAENQVYTCTYEGEGEVSSCGTKERHANDPQAGYCRHHKFTAQECGGKLPAADKHADNCIVATREFVQCGEGQDFAATIGKDGGAQVSWYTAGWSAVRAGSGGNCSSARIVVDYMCPGECNRKCINGKLNGVTCNCECNPGWSGRECQNCGVEEKDCLHGSTFNPTKCKCEVPEGTYWVGAFAQDCKLAQDDCKNGGLLDSNSCKCIECNEGFKGKLCTECDRAQDQCKQGSSLDTTTCTCSVDCPTSGIFCEKCPKGKNGEICSGSGQCQKSKCVCNKGATGKTCTTKPMKLACAIKTGKVVPFKFKSKTGKPIVADKAGEYRLFEVIKKEKDELTSVHGYFHKVGSLNLLVGISVSKVNNFNSNNEVESFRIMAKKGSDGFEVTQDCTSKINVRSKWIQGSKKHLKIRAQGQSSLMVKSNDNQFEINIDKFKCEYGTCFSFNIDLLDNPKIHHFLGMCGSHGKKEEFLIVDTALQQIQCKGEQQEIDVPLRFKSVRSSLLRGPKNVGSQSYRFLQLKTDWDTVDWELPTPSWNSESPIEEPVTSYNLIAQDCKAATVSSTELECRMHLPESFPQGFVRSDPALEPYKACADVLCDEADPEKAHKMANIETLKAKRKRKVALEEEAAQKQIDAESKVASKIAQLAENADPNDNKC